MKKLLINIFTLFILSNMGYAQFMDDYQYPLTENGDQFVNLTLYSSLLNFNRPVYVEDIPQDELVWIETELFQNKGGWTHESQFIDEMGSPYLLAHGLGYPVANAETKITFNKTGEYHFWVRTKDWVPTDTHAGPGKFRVLINNVPVGDIFGADKIKHWHWVYGGKVSIKSKEVKLSLQDLTGFDGRCDAICFSPEKIDLPDDLASLEEIRKRKLKIKAPQYSGHYDLIVAGGGVAGVAAAVQAARFGLRVALIQNRPVLGGNSSSEVRVSMDGDTYRNKYPAIGRVVREMDNYEAGVGGSAYLYRDKTKDDIVKNEKNITLFTNLHVNGVQMQGDKISGVTAVNILTLEEYSFTGDLFADCTGDASVGRLAGADYRYGRESKAETGEPSAPAKEDNLVMGSSNQWRTVLDETPSDFPVQPWMFKLTEDYHFPIVNSQWDWESGFDNLHTVYQAEEIRDLNFCAIYSNWAFLKTHKTEQFGKRRLSEVQHITGKRESFRLLGDIVLTEDDVVNKIEYPDAVVTTTWGIDLHYPHPENSKRFPGMEFIAYAEHKYKQNDVYTFPYRCLYSRNIPNLFMAGRNISVTHIALGTVRVQRCTGMMGEVVGAAAYVCNKNGCTPREVYEQYLDEFLELIQKMCN